MTAVPIICSPALDLPRMSLPATTGGEITSRMLAGMTLAHRLSLDRASRHPQPAALGRHPGAHGSTPELEGFRDLAADFGDLDLGLFGLSRQTTDYQREMAARLAASLSDP